MKTLLLTFAILFATGAHAHRLESSLTTAITSDGFFNREVGDYFLDKLVNITGSTEQELIEMKQSFWKDCEYVVPNDVLHDTKKLMSLLEKMVESADSLTTILVFRVNTTHDIDITLTEIGNELLDKFYSIRFVVELSGIYEHFDFMEYPNTWSSDKEFALFSIIKYAYDLPNTEVGIVISVNTMNILHILDLIWFLKERLDIDIKFSISNIDIFSEVLPKHYFVNQPKHDNTDEALSDLESRLSKSHKKSQP